MVPARAMLAVRWAVCFVFPWVGVPGVVPQERLRRIPSLEGPAAPGALPKLGHPCTDPTGTSTSSQSTTGAYFGKGTFSLSSLLCFWSQIPLITGCAQQNNFSHSMKKKQTPTSQTQSDNALIASAEGKLQYST